MIAALLILCAGLVWVCADIIEQQEEVAVGDNLFIPSLLVIAITLVLLGTDCTNSYRYRHSTTTPIEQE